MATLLKQLIGNAIVSLPDVYQGSGPGGTVSDITGVTQLGDTLPDNVVNSTIRAQVLAGTCRRFRVRLSTGKIHNMYCTAANATKITALQGATYSGTTTIKTAYFPQHYTYGA